MTDSNAPQDTIKRISVIAAILFVVALGLRFVGIDQGLPHRGEPDTYIVLQAERLLLEGLGDRHRAGWKYPHFVATVVAAVPAEDIVRPPDGASLAEHTKAATALHLRTRKVAAFLSALAAPATFLIALRFLPLAWAALSGLLVATSLLHICFSVQARPHGPVSALAALTILAALRWAERPSIGRALCLGLAAACAVGTLHTGLAVLAPITVAAVTALRRGRLDRRRIALGALLIGTLIATSTAWFYVRADDGYGMNAAKNAAAVARQRSGSSDEQLAARAKTEEFVAARKQGHRTVRFSGHVVDLELFNGRGFGVAWRALRRYDPILLLLALIGVAAALPRSRSALRTVPPWIVLGFALPTLLLYGLYAKSTDRFLVILVPMVMLVAANGLRVIATRVPRVGPTVAALMTLAVVAGAARTAQLRTRPDTAQEAALWLENNVERDAPTHLGNLRTLPLFVEPAHVTEDFLWSRGPWEAYQWILLDPGSQPIRGERDAPETPTRDAAERLGRNHTFATVADRYRLVLADDREQVARDVLAAAAPSTVLVKINPPHLAGPVTPREIARAWHAALQDPPWTRVRRIECGLGDDEPALEYRLDFVKIFRVRALGPTIEIYSSDRD